MELCGRDISNRQGLAYVRRMDFSTCIQDFIFHINNILQMTDFFKNNGLPILIGLLILFGVTFLSESIFGDLTREDSYKPLWIILPVFVSVLGYLVYKTNKK